MKTTNNNNNNNNNNRRMFTPTIALQNLVSSALHEDESIGNAAAEEIARRFHADEIGVIDIMHASHTANRYAAVQRRLLPALNRY